MVRFPPTDSPPGGAPSPCDPPTPDVASGPDRSGVLARQASGPARPPSKPTGPSRNPARPPSNPAGQPRNPAGPPTDPADHPCRPRGPSAPGATERLGDEIARLAAHIDAATYELLCLIREFDEREGWSKGFKSCAHWLSWRTSIGPGAAREKVRVARALGELPLLSEAMRKGEMSYSKVRALTRMATPETEEELLGMARHATAAQLEKMKNGWQSVKRAEERFLEQERHATRELWIIPEQDGSWTLRGRVDPEAGAVLDKALKAASEALYRKDSEAWKQVPAAAKRADALGLVAEVALGTGFVVELEEAEDPVASNDGSRARSAPPSEEGEAMPVAPDGEPEPSETPSDDGAHDAPATVSEEESDEPQPEAATVDTAPIEATTVPTATTPKAVPTATTASSSPTPTEPTPGSPPERERRRRRKIFGRAERFQVVLHVDADTLSGSSDKLGESRIDGGPRVSAETSRRLSCDCTRRVMTEDSEGNVLDVGRRTRTVPPALRRALERRDGGCRFPDHSPTASGARGLKICEGHHVVHWKDGGETKLANLALLCRFHHRFVHEGGWRMAMGPDQDVSCFRPDGRPLPQVPEPPPVPERPVKALVRKHREDGIEMDAWTPTPLWRGERLDLGYAVHALIKLDERACVRDRAVGEGC